MTRQEIEGLVYEYGDDIYRFCCYLTGNKTLADDLYQDTFLTALKSRNKIINDKNVKNYLIGISINLWKNQTRKSKRRYEIAPITIFDEKLEKNSIGKRDVLDEYISKELINEVRDAVNTLSEKQRVVVLMYYSAEMSVMEIAKVLCVPKGTVLSRLAKARESLKKEMEARGYEY